MKCINPAYNEDGVSTFVSHEEGQWTKWKCSIRKRVTKGIPLVKRSYITNTPPIVHSRQLVKQVSTISF